MKTSINKIEFNDCKIIIACILVFVLGIISCSKKKNTKNELSLNPKYLQIEDINTIAICSGPEGNYVTKVMSKKDGSLFFSQTYNYRDAPFIAKITSDNKGYVIDENKKVIDTLSDVSIEMIRSHDFHRLQINPNHFFSNIKFEKKVDQEIEQYSAIDRLNNPVKIYYDRSIKQLKKIEFLNMMDTTELIEIVNKKWIDSDYGKIVKEIEIIQAKKDTFNFSFEKVEINK